MNQTASLYIVALPIGNYSDISERALEVLNKVDCIAAEDTRNLRSLAQHFRINVKQLVAHHNHNETESLTGLLSLLEEGKSIALVSDAGTPNICDPGYKLTKTCLEKGYKIVPVPGASALTTTLSISPIGGTDHFFCGFLPSKENDRIKKLNSFRALKAHCSKVVFFESPHRLLDCLKNIAEELIDPKVFVAREITKKYESFYFDNASKLIESIPSSEVKGEFVLCLDLQTIGDNVPEMDLEEEIKKQLSEGIKAKLIQKNLVSKSKISSKELYSLIVKIKDSLNQL